MTDEIRVFDDAVKRLQEYGAPVRVMATQVSTGAHIYPVAQTWTANQPVFDPGFTPIIPHLIHMFEDARWAWTPEGEEKLSVACEHCWDLANLARVIIGEPTVDYLAEDDDEDDD